MKEVAPKKEFAPSLIFKSSPPIFLNEKGGKYFHLSGLFPLEAFPLHLNVQHTIFILNVWTLYFLPYF